MDLKIGNCYEIIIEDMGHKGEAIGKIEGFTVFVEGALKGDVVLARLTEKKKNYGTAEICKILRHSNMRTVSACEVSKFCGGCQIMEMKYEEQLNMKRNMVEEHLKRIGECEDITVLPVIGMKEPYAYRNKGQYPIAVQNGEVVTGFYKVRSHEIIPINRCILQKEICDTAVNAVRAFVKEKGISIYEEQTQKGNLRRIVIKIGFATGEVMVVLITKEKELAHKKELVKRLKSSIPNLRTVVQNIQPHSSNTVMGRENKVLYGEGIICDKLNGLTFEISPLSFYQVNPVQTEVLYGKALKYAQLSGTETVLDLYCGIGTISLFMARNAKKVYGVEIVEAAIEDAKKNAICNNIENVEFICGKSEEVLPRLYQQGIRADVVMLDPPRKGCEESVLRVIAEMNVPKIVYVSCNSATLARDMKLLKKTGYETNEIQPVDMFCHTMHVECVVLLSKVHPYAQIKKKINE